METNKVDIKIGFECNNHCRFCIKGDKRSRLKNKSKEEVMQILEEEKNICNEVVFTGGEPTVQKNLPDYVKYAKHLGYKRIVIQSNGRMFSYKDYCKNLIGAGVTVFNPAIHGHNAKTHDYLTNVPGSFNQTLKGIKNLKELNQNIVTQTVITKINYKHLPKIAKMLNDLDVNTFQFAFIHINPIIQNNPKLIEEIVPRYHLIAPYVKKAIEVNKEKARTEAIPFCFLAGYENNISEPNIPQTVIYDGNNITKDFTKVRKEMGKMKSEKCKKCKYYHYCEGPWKDYPEIFGWDEFIPVK